ncbi:MAG TPA: DUF2807 domain-containing protein [Planctomycetes bacterium]|nr:DUF2807 domain-containing protein [Planctomycetota bacterium]
MYPFPNLSASKLALPVLASFLGGCIIVHSDTTRWAQRGSGVRAEVTRDLPSFHAVELDTAADVIVHVGGAPRAVVSADDDLLEHVETRVRGGVLEISVERGYLLRGELRVELTTPSLDSFSIDGAGDVAILGVEGSALELDIDGAGTVRAEGTVDRLEAEIDGAGTFELGELDVRNASVSVDGAGSMDLHVSDRLTYRIDGSGELSYTGDPSVSGTVSGAGTVSRRPSR